MSQAVENHFDKLASSGGWESLYDGPLTAHNASFRVRLSKTLDLLPADVRTVMDLGCGPAALSAPLTTRGVRYVGLDLSMVMLKRAQARHGRLKLVRGAVPLPFRDGAFDAVMALGFIEYLADIPAALQEMKRVTRPGGFVVVSTPKAHHLDRLIVRISSPMRALAARIWGRRSDSIVRTLLDPLDLDRLARNAGLEPAGGAHYHFTPLPYPLTVLAPRLSLAVNHAFEKRLTKRGPGIAWLAHGFIGRYRHA